MLYDRKIKYLDYYEGGTKVNGGGFAKLEVRDNTLRLELAIRGLRPTDSFERDIVLQGTEKEETLGQIRIQNGCGQFRCSCDVNQKIGATGISYSDLRGIRIPIGGTREILCQWDNVSDKRRINPLEENPPKSKTGLQESKKESIAESHTDSKADSEAPVYIGSEQPRAAKLEKTKKAEEKREGAEKEGYKSINDKDRKEENREVADRETQEEEDRKDEDRKGQEGKSKEDKDREGQEGKSREGKDREGQEGKSREDKNREDKDGEGQEGESKEGKNREDKDREGQEDKSREGENREVKDREEQEENKEVREDTKKAIKKDIERKESREKDNKGLEIRGEDIKNDAKPGPTEMQAQGAAMPSDAIFSQFPEGAPETDLQPEEQIGDRAKDKSDMAGNNPAGQPDVRKAPVKLMEDKWQQLSAIYPHIQPFRDERDYLSLTPSDFVLFPDRFYRAVNNSFLLHGYYNYHHLILARIEHRGEIIYYIGVPGNYFEREKQVAIMFGFESFECETEPAKTGDFGYYMMRTEL